MKERTKEELENLQENYSEESVTSQIIDQLIAEIEKPKVWDGAPDYCAEACVNFVDKSSNVVFSQEYRRTLPKTREYQLAEEIYTMPLSSDFTEGVEQIAAILRREKELEEGR